MADAAVKIDAPRASLEFAPARVSVEDLPGGGFILRSPMALEPYASNLCEHLIHWDGTDDAGNRTASGVYFMRVEAGPNRAARKVVLLR